MAQERKDAQNVMKRIPRLNTRENDNLREMLGLEIKSVKWDWDNPSVKENSGHNQSEWGLNNMTKQNLSKDVKPLDVNT